MSLFRLNRTGLLAKETTALLEAFGKSKNWEKASSELFRLGLVSSKTREQEIVAEIKKRISLSDPLLPNYEDLIALASSNIDLISKSEIYYVYLFFANDLISKITNSLMEVYEKNKNEPIITRGNIALILTSAINHSSRKVGEKTKRNWIGKFLSVLKDGHILISRKSRQYYINFGGITPETWTFFILHSCIKNYPPLNGKFISAFHILPEHIPRFIEKSSNKNWLQYSNVEMKDNYIRFEVKSKYLSIEEWISDL